jgi:hypothetical protein
MTTPWQEVRALAEKATAAETVARHAKPGTMDARIADDTWHAARAELSRAAMALLRDPAFIGMMEDAARYRKLRGMSLRDVAVIFDPGMDRDATRVMRDRDTRIDAFQRAALSAQLAGDGERGK